MSSSRSQRMGRIAACTALALAAGTLLSAGPAVAAGEPAKPKPSASAPTPQLTVKPGGSASGPAKSTFAFKRAKPRLDLDGDGWSDFLFRNHFAYYNSLQSSTNSVTPFKVTNEATETPRDVVAVGNIRGGWGPELLLWHGDGRLAMHQAYNTGTQAATWTGTGWQIYNKLIAAGDLTGDGRGDLLARTPSGDLYLYRATGAATGEPFAGRVKVGGGWGIYDQIVGANDVDADGYADLLAKDLNGNLYYYKGTGSTSAPFKARTWVGGGWNTYNKIVAADDWTGDGKADLFGVLPGGDLYFYASLGNGKFSAREKNGSGWQAEEILVNSGVTPVYGKHSVSGIDGTNEIWEHVNKTNGRFYDKPLDWPVKWEGGTLVNAAGLDKINWTHRLIWNGTTLHNRNKGANVSGDFSNTNLVVGPGDLNGDGRGDLLSRDTWGNLWLRSGNGTGTWFGSPVKVGPGWNSYKTIVGGGDINGDGRPDIVAASHDGHLYVYKGTGNASAPFGAREWYSGGWNGYTGIAVPGDLNGDGRADLIARDSGGTMWLYRSQGWGGTSAFAGRQWLAQGWNTYTQFN
ncbi:FG-GAP repeat domain-containing protein [Streptomyces sp. NPDC048603]|uniref:FG-GAP repeat domain-containing protein n=1 Tax=Streptomyces sp. NPDC048603 TaxID=3365577 RepID=UPI003720CE78